MTYIEDHMRAAFEDHVLVVLCETDSLMAYRLRIPGRRALSMLLTFSMEGIAITGDLRLGTDRNGVHTREKCSPWWFADADDERNLCSKFLRDVWTVARAKAALTNYLADEAAEFGHSAEVIAQLREVLKWVEIYDGAHDFHDALVEAGLDPEDAGMGWGIDPVDAGWLCVIRERFRELWQRHPPTTDPAPLEVSHD